MALLETALGGALGLAGGVLANQGAAAQAQKQMDFQARMSNTAHQRQVEDLKKAGLNPLLSATGGASSPVGAMATQENVAQSAVTSAKEAGTLALAKQMQIEQLKNMGEQNKLLKSQQRKTDMETHVMSKGVPEADIKNNLYNWGLEKLKQMNQNSAVDTHREKTINQSKEMREALERIRGKKAPIKHSPSGIRLKDY